MSTKAARELAQLRWQRPGERERLAKRNSSQWDDLTAKEQRDRIDAMNSARLKKMRKKKTA